MEKQNLDILPGGILPVIHCSQGDIGRQFQINLYSDNAPYVLDGTEELTLDGHKEDGNIFTYSLDPVTGSTITISTEEQMTACAGNVICEIRIFKDTTRLGTCNFILQVEEGPSNGIPSESTLQALDEIRAEIQQAVVDSEGYADAAKSWAVGPNGSGEGTDTNNSKYYSQESSSSATSSANSATDSKNWAVGPSGSGSGTDSNNSKYYSQQSSNSASAASSSASDAKNWAVGPSGSGSGTDSNNAKYYATQADSAKSDAVQAKNDAVSAKNDAVSAKNAAESSATDSKNWAVGPSGSGSGTDSNNSKYYANQASSSASDAINAKTSAEAAQQKIENMTVSASQLAEGSSPTVTKTEVGGVVNLAFGIPKGDTGATGPTGPRGADGLGVPAGGTTGQVLAKASNADNDTEWVDPSGGGAIYPIADIQALNNLSPIAIINNPIDGNPTVIMDVRNYQYGTDITLPATGTYYLVFGDMEFDYSTDTVTDIYPFKINPARFIETHDSWYNFLLTTLPMTSRTYPTLGNDVGIYFNRILPSAYGSVANAPFTPFGILKNGTPIDPSTLTCNIFYYYDNYTEGTLINDYIGVLATLQISCASTDILKINNRFTSPISISGGKDPVMQASSGESFVHTWNYFN